jgi:acetyltransferase-like isoleucine patch superfamily enzyme
MFDLLTRISNKIHGIIWRWLFRWDFFFFGAGSTVLKPLRIHGARWMYVGTKVLILDSAWLLALPSTERAEKREPLITIGDGTYIGHFSHIVAVEDVQIGKKVMIADRVYISDNIHSFEDVSLPIIDQPVRFRSAVVIGDGAWIGENACIIGARVGRNCVVSANSVVTKDVPDFCVVAGVPARIVQHLS